MDSKHVSEERALHSVYEQSMFSQDVEVLQTLANPSTWAKLSWVACLNSISHSHRENELMDRRRPSSQFNYVFIMLGILTNGFASVCRPPKQVCLLNLEDIKI